VHSVAGKWQIPDWGGTRFSPDRCQGGIAEPLRKHRKADWVKKAHWRPAEEKKRDKERQKVCELKAGKKDKREAELGRKPAQSRNGELENTVSMERGKTRGKLC